MFESKDSVINWFGDRGIPVKTDQLKHWHWEKGKLWFVFEEVSSMYFSDTDKGMADVVMTHDDDGNPILCYELYDTVPIAESPLRKKRNSPRKAE